MAVNANLGQASVAIRATLDKLDGDLGQARGKIGGAVQSIAKGAASSLQTIGTGAVAAIGMAVGAVTGLGVALAKITIDAAPVEGVKDAFYGLADAAGVGGDAMIDALKQGSSGMIANRDLMLSFNKAASLVSVDFAQQLPDAMQYLSKVSAATGQDMGFLMDSLVTGVGRLSPMILDNLSIQVSLAEATDRAAQMFGVEASELSKAQIQAGMMDVTLEKLAANTADMPDVSQSAAASMAKMKASFQDTKDQIGMAFLPTLTNLVGIIGDLAARFLPPLTDFLENVLAPAFEHISQVVQDFFFMLDIGVEPINALKIVLSELFGQDMADTIMGIVDSVMAFIATAQEALAPVIEFITENVKLQDVLIALGIAIATVVVPIIWSLIAAAAPVIATFLVLVGLVAAIRAAWESDFMGIRTAVENALATIAAWWAAHGEEVKAKALEIWENVKTFISVAFETIKTIISEAITAIQAWWAEHGDAIMEKAAEIWLAVVQTFEWFKGQFTRLFQAFALAFQGDWEGFGRKLREYWDEGWKKLQEIGQVTWDAIVKFFNETDWGAIGTSIIQGIANGITAAAAWLADAARRAAQAAYDAAMGFFGNQAADTSTPRPGPGQNAQGTMNWRGGLSWVGEQGMELLNIPSRSQIYNMNQLERLLKPDTQQQAGNNITIYGLTLEGVQDKAGLLAELQALT